MACLGKRKGAVLIVVLGVLCILALLATTFATLQITERQIARNYLDTVRAKLLAMSGVEDATARLKDAFPFRAFDLSGAAARAWIYYGAETDRYNKVPVPTPIEKAVNPSFAHENEAVQDPTVPNLPQNFTIEGQPRGFSGVMGSGSYGQYTEHYALKVSDLSGHIHVNDGLEGGPTGGVSQNLKRILNILGQIKPSVDVPNLGDTILAGRPTTGYQHVNNLLAVLGYDAAAFKRVREFVTVNAWVDPNVANPVPLSQALVDYEKSQGNPMPENYGKVRGGLYRFGRSKNTAGNEIVPAAGLNTWNGPGSPPALPSAMSSACVYGLDTLNPQWIEIVSRAPVNVNAAPREVLMALLSDLKGFFLTDRRRNNPRWSGGEYPDVVPQISYSSAGTEGDEYGYLAQTQPILPPPTGSRVAGQIYADDIADHLIACRDRKAFGGFDYGTVPWGGPFRNWSQFNTFVDNLVAIGVLQDSRSLWFDYPDNDTVDPKGYGVLVPSAIQRRHAAQAIADVLKANFNPNLHLNELNPDANLTTIVDKTDLIVNSTEFAFLPTGYFEIESLGRVVRPKGAAAIPDARSGDNELIAQAKITAVVKLYELYRETNQKQFAAGTLGPNAGIDTHNGKTVEIGPEPEDGKGNGDKEWDGYIGLPTVGGPSHGAGSQFGDALHVHFTQTFDAHYHLFDGREIAGRTLPGETVMNYPDLPGLPSGPYDPINGDHRLARSFRVKPGVTTPSLTPYAPSDLRIDGGYSERHAAPAYFTSTSGAKIWDFDNEPARGMVSFWMKPSFAPERTGKIRCAWDLSRYHENCPYTAATLPSGLFFSHFGAWFYPSHYDPLQAESIDPVYTDTGFPWMMRPSSLGFGLTLLCDTPEPAWAYRITTGLNHGGHPDQATTPSLLQANRWIHLACSWHAVAYDYIDTQGEAVKMYVNGSLNYAPYHVFALCGVPQQLSTLYSFSQHLGGAYNQMRLGAPSKIAAAPAAASSYMNHAADFTLGEFYVWREAPETSPQVSPYVTWRRGRYYKPLGAGEGIFASQAVGLNSSSARLLAPASTVAPPGGPPSPGPTMVLPPPVVRILGMAWTWHGEPRDENVTPLASWDGKPVLYDYYPAGVPAKNLKPKAELRIKDPATPVGWSSDDGFSAVRATDGSTPALQNPLQVKYEARLSLDSAAVDPLNTILLATPVLDDVTIYWDDGGATLVSYVYDNRTF